MHTTEYQYIQTNHRSHLFLAHYSPVNPSSGSNQAQAIILVPPFAEEMNRAKRMYVLCARMLANSGYHVFFFDHSGTGDSSGEWGDFTYQDWLSDLTTIWQFANNIASDVSFIALRFGALLLADALANQQLVAEKCIFWDPIENGEILTRQLVRMKIAAAMADDAKKITSKEVMQAMQEKGFLESAGYHITHDMYEQINTKKLANDIASLIEKVDLHWMMLGKFKPGENKWLPNSVKPADIESLATDNAITMHPVNDVKFWMQQEVTISPRLLQVTHQVFARG